MAYQVPMIEVAAIVALSGLEPEEHFLYLAPYSERREGPETVEDYVNGVRRFFPMVSGGVPKIINRDQVIEVALAGELQLVRHRIERLDRPSEGR